MKFLLIALLALSAFSQRVGGGSGSVPIPKAIPTVTALPITCSVGSYVFKSNATAGSNTYACTSANTWTLQGGGGGGGSITSGLVAFGDGTSTPATDSNLAWDNVNKRLQVGPLDSNWTGYEANIQASVMFESVAPYATYKDYYPFLMDVVYGDNTTGASKLDIYGANFRVTVKGNTDLASDGDGLYSFVVRSSLQDTAQASYVYGGSMEIDGTGSSVMTTLKLSASGGKSGGTIKSLDVAVPNGINGATPYAIYVDNTNANGSNYSIYSAGHSARHMFGGTTYIGPEGTGGSANLIVNGTVTFASGNTTGAGSASLGANSPASTLSAPYTWFPAIAQDGTPVFIPAWK